MEDATRTVFQRFVKMAERLSERNFVKFAMENRVGYTMKLTDDGSHVEQHVPDAEAIEAALLTLRMFIQGNDPISIRNMAAVAASDSTLSPEWRGWLTDARDTLNSFLDRPSGIVLGTQAITNREVLNAFLYGDKGHTTQADLIEQWRTMGPMFPILESWFVMTIVDIVRVIFRIEAITRAELNGDPLPQPPTASTTT